MNKRLSDRISLLSQLARIDGDFDIRELTFIYAVCIRNKVELDEIPNIISHPQPVIAFGHLTPEDRVNYLTDIILLIMIDGKVLPSEVHFALEIAEHLGFDRIATHGLINDICDAKGITEAAIKEKVNDLLTANKS